MSRHDVAAVDVLNAGDVDEPHQDFHGDELGAGARAWLAAVWETACRHGDKDGDGSWTCTAVMCPSLVVTCTLLPSWTLSFTGLLLRLLDADGEGLAPSAACRKLPRLSLRSLNPLLLASSTSPSR